MTALHDFNNILKSFSRVWSSRKRDQCVVSLALPIKGIDPLFSLPVLATGQQFRFLWDVDPADCLAAAGKSQHIEITGPRRFELAQNFADSIFGKLLDLTTDVPTNARPRILIVCSFFEQISVRDQSSSNPSSLQAVLPRWQLARHGRTSFLRINGVVTHEADARELADQLWIMGKRISNIQEEETLISCRDLPSVIEAKEWKSCYQSILGRGIELVDSGQIKKLVLAVRQSIYLQKPLDPLSILLRLRTEQRESCRFMWENNLGESFFGASPERLMTLQGNNLCSEAVAGTASVHSLGDSLLNSDKNLREHQVVVSSIAKQLSVQGCKPKYAPKPQIVRFGKLMHLRTRIFSKVTSSKPFQFIDNLHPTPAVSGFPIKDAMNWIRVLEPFERGRYAAPIGWVDSLGNAEFRVAIRCGNCVGNKLDLIAGAGLVRGSVVEKEVKEVGLKFDVLANQFDFIPKI